MMTIANSLLQMLRGTHDSRLRFTISIVTWSLGSCISAELLGYWLHRLLHSGAIRFLSRNHMKHHLVLYGPLQKQRSATYYDATENRPSLGNIGLEWLIPAALIIAVMLVSFYLLHVTPGHQLLCLGITLSWSSLMFSYLHDVMHVEGLWLEKNRFLKRWFLSARRLHDIHHRVLNDEGLMNKNFGIGLFLFDRLFGTICLQQTPFNHRGYKMAKEKFRYVDATGVWRISRRDYRHTKHGSVEPKTQGIHDSGLSSSQALSTGRLFLLVLLILAGTGPVAAQSESDPQGHPALQRRCTSVALRSETRLLPSRLVTESLQSRGDFQASNLILVQQENSADAVVVLRQSSGGQTSVSAFNRITGQYQYATTGWTDYPGLVASNVMDQLRIICPGSVHPPPPYGVVKQCSKIAVVHRPIVSLAACSKTSWMTDGEIYKELRSQRELRRSAVHLRPASTPTDAILEVSHSLDVTVEWYWELWSTEKERLAGGRVIAFCARDAAKKIADDAARTIDVLGVPQPHRTSSHRDVSRYQKVTPLTANVALLPTDFTVRDNRMVLYTDGEGVKARDMTGRLVFTIAREDLRDVRLRTDWNHPLELGEPTPLLRKIEAARDHFSDPTVTVGDSLEINLHPAQLLLYGAEFVAYVGLAPMLAQVRTLSQALDLAWEEKGAVKTVSLQVPGSESGQLLHALYTSRSRESDNACPGSQGEDSGPSPRDQ